MCTDSNVAANRTTFLCFCGLTVASLQGGADTLLTVGFSSGGRGRQLGLWDPRSMAKPLIKKKVDTATGQLLPL